MRGVMAALGQYAYDIGFAAGLAHHLMHVSKPRHLEFFTGFARNAWQNVAYSDKFCAPYMSFS